MEEGTGAGEQRRSRHRAVRLKPDALALLIASVEGRLSESGVNRKLTRRAKAEFLEISERTLHQVLANGGVDRSTLVHVFARIGFEWEEEWLERPDQVPEAAPPPTRGARRLRWLPVAATACMVVAVGIFWWRPVEAQKPSRQDWDQVFRKNLDGASADYHAARYAEGMAHVDAAISIARSHTNAPKLAGALQVAGDLALATGDVERASRSYKEARHLLQQARDDAAQTYLTNALASIETRRGNFTKAQELLKESLLNAERFRQTFNVIEAQRDLGTVAFEEGNWAEALSWYASAKVTLGHSTLDPMFQDIRSREALVYRETGRLDEAKAVLEECLGFWIRSGHPRWIARTQLNLGTVELKLGSRERAHELFTAARDAFARVNDKASLAEAQGQLRDLTASD